VGVRIALAAAIAVLAVAGCGGDDPSPTSVPTQVQPSAPTAVTTAPPTTAPTTPTTSPTPTPPPLSAAARQDTPTGAESFARHWLATLDYAYKTGDTKPFRAAGGCNGCVSLANSIDKVYAGGGEVTGGALTAIETRVDRHVAGSAAAVELYYSRTQRIVLDGKGGRFVDPAAKRLGFLLVLERLDQQWQVERFPVLGR
jgi:hypothetical protein